MSRNLFKSLSIVSLCFFVAGCSLVDDVYVWENKIGDVSELRVKIDETKQQVFIVEKFIPKRKLDDDFYIKDMSYLKHCSIVNTRNWICQVEQDRYYNISEKVAMVEGSLIYMTGSLRREYQITYRPAF